MKTDELGQRMRGLEVYHALRVPAGAWTILRIDGCGFSKLTAQHFEKPFDERFSGCMVAAAQALAARFQAVYTYTESDEISLLLPRSSDIFDRELEKLVSITAGTASAAFSLAAGVAASFDSRVIVAPRTSQAIDYFRWRQSDAARCALNGWSYWTLRKAGESQAKATAALLGLSTAQKHELLFSRGVNFAELPAWHRRGIGLYMQTYEKSSIDARTGESVAARRKRLYVDRELPAKEAYGEWLKDHLLPQPVT